ncbi:MAG TPA: thylakoid-associated protein [Crinalium sp.]|jgi:hypothetical protein
MFTTYFDGYQKQFDDWQRHINDWQKQFFDAWTNNLPNTKDDIHFSEGFDKALGLQEEMVKSYLDAQEKANKMMLDSQRKFWNDYFETLRKKAATANSTN